MLTPRFRCSIIFTGELSFAWNPVGSELRNAVAIVPPSAKEPDTLAIVGTTLCVVEDITLYRGCGNVFQVLYWYAGGHLHQLYISSHLPPCAASRWNCLTDLESSNGQACQKHVQICGKSQSILLLVLMIMWYPSGPLFRYLLPCAPRSNRQRQRSTCLPCVCKQMHRGEGRPWPRQAGVLTSRGSATRGTLHGCGVQWWKRMLTDLGAELL